MIPYDGPQDEIEQMQRSGAVMVVRERAVERACEVAAGPVYGVDLRTLAAARTPAGEKYALFLLRLHALLEWVLAGGGETLDGLENLA